MPKPPFFTQALEGFADALEAAGIDPHAVEVSPPTGSTSRARWTRRRPTRLATSAALSSAGALPHSVWREGAVRSLSAAGHPSKSIRQLSSQLGNTRSGFYDIRNKTFQRR